MEPTVKGVMTTTVVAVKQGTSYKEMAALLRKYRVSAFPVLVAEIRHVQGVVAVNDKLGDPPAEASFAGLHF